MDCYYLLCLGNLLIKETQFTAFFEWLGITELLKCMRLHCNSILYLITNQATNTNKHNHWALNGRFLLILKALQLTMIQWTWLPVKLNC